MTYLWSGIKGVTSKSAAEQEDHIKMIYYTMQFHLGPESGQPNMNGIHGAFHVQYGYEYSVNSAVNQLKGIKK